MLYIIRDRLSLDDIVYELQHNDSTVVSGSMPLYLLSVCDPEPSDVPLTLAYRVENTRNVHRLKWFHNIVL